MREVCDHNDRKDRVACTICLEGDRALLIVYGTRLAEENERLREALLKANAYLEQLSYSGGNALLPEIRAALDRTRSAEGIAGREGESK